MYVTGEKLASIVTVPLSVVERFLKNLFFVGCVPSQLSDTVVFVLPILDVELLMPDAVQPVNVYPSFVGLSILITELYFPVAGCDDPSVPPFVLYVILYVIGVQLTFNSFVQLSWRISQKSSDEYSFDWSKVFPSASINSCPVTAL